MKGFLETTSYETDRKELGRGKRAPRKRILSSEDEPVVPKSKGRKKSLLESSSESEDNENETDKESSKS